MKRIILLIAIFTLAFTGIAYGVTGYSGKFRNERRFNYERNERQEFRRGFERGRGLQLDWCENCLNFNNRRRGPINT